MSSLGLESPLIVAPGTTFVDEVFDNSSPNLRPLESTSHTELNDYQIGAMLLDRSEDQLVVDMSFQKNMTGSTSGQPAREQSELLQQNGLDFFLVGNMKLFRIHKLRELLKKLV
ncbi:hypothetical protein V6N13_065723 [Hibiscus sabdariffa]